MYLDEMVFLMIGELYFCHVIHFLAGIKDYWFSRHARFSNKIPKQFRAKISFGSLCINVVFYCVSAFKCNARCLSVLGVNSRTFLPCGKTKDL